MTASAHQSAPMFGNDCPFGVEGCRSRLVKPDPEGCSEWASVEELFCRDCYEARFYEMESIRSTLWSTTGRDRYFDRRDRWRRQHGRFVGIRHVVRESPGVTLTPRRTSP